MLPPIGIIYTVIGTISMSLYILLIATLLHFRVRRREVEYRSSFFAIFISLGAADILQRVSSQFTSTLLFDPNLQAFYLTVGNSNARLLAKFGVFLTNFLGFAQFGGHLLVSLNRYTAMSYPIKHETIWSKRNLIIAISMQWIISFLLTIYIMFIDSSFHAEYDYVALFIDYDESPIANEVSNLWCASVTCLLCFAILIINLLAFKNYRKSNQNKQFSQSNTQQNSIRRRFEIQLFVFSIAAFFIMLPISIAQGLSALATMINSYPLLSAINPQWPWIIEVTCDFNPYILLITSGLLRKRIRKMFTSNATRVTTVSAVNSSKKIDTFLK